MSATTAAASWISSFSNACGAFSPAWIERAIGSRALFPPTYSMVRWCASPIITRLRMGICSVTFSNITNWARSLENAPGAAFSNERAQLVIFEKVTEQIPIRSRVMIGDAHHRTIEDVGGNSARLPIARSIHAGENAPQAFENELIHEAAAVVADINDQAFFANLREKLFNECIEATVTHIGQ